MSGIYWTLTALELGGAGNRLNKTEIVEFVKTCQHECGGFGASVSHDPHLLYTLSALQILVSYEAVDQIDVEKVVQFIAGFQQVGRRESSRLRSVHCRGFAARFESTTEKPRNSAFQGTSLFHAFICERCLIANI